MIGDAALLLAAQRRVSGTRSTWARRGRTGPGCRSSSRCGRRGGEADQAAVQAVHARLLESRAWGLAHLDELADAGAAATTGDRPSRSAAPTSATSTTRFPTGTWPGSPTSSAGWRRTGWCRTGQLSLHHGGVEPALRPNRWLDHERDRSHLKRVPGLPRALREGRRCSSWAELADAERWRHHPEPVVTYIIDRNINYTNVCVADCEFCAFYRRPKHDEGLRAVASSRSARKIDECKAHGRGADPAAGRAQPVHPVRVVPRADALHQAQPSDPHPRLLAVGGRLLQRALPACRCAEVVRELREAGLDSIPGGGGEILVDEIRQRVAHEEGADRGVARRAGGGPPPGDEDLGHDDVRPGRDRRRPDRAPVPGARAPGAGPAASRRSSAGRSSPRARRRCRTCRRPTR